MMSQVEAGCKNTFVKSILEYKIYKMNLSFSEYCLISIFHAQNSRNTRLKRTK